MTILEINRIVEGKYPSDAKPGKPEKTATLEQLEEFKLLLSINDAYLQKLNQTEVAKEFYTACPLLDAVVEDDLKEDLFYATKLGFMYTGIPSKLVFLLKKGLKLVETPNRVIECMDMRLFGKYLKPGVLPEGITIKQILSNLIGTDYKTLTKARRKVKYKDFYEVYVDNTDRVVLLPECIAEQVDSSTDLKNVNYQKDIGVCVYNMPLRTFAGKLGITKDEYDLRECI